MGVLQMIGWRNTMRCTLLALAAAPLATGAAAEPVTREQVLAALPQLAEMAQAQVGSGGVPGLAIAVVHDDELVYATGFGVREEGKPETVDGDTVFQIASMSKPISATVVAALVGKEIVAWETLVRDLTPDVALHDPYPTAEVTVRDFFNHRSGLPGSAGNDLENIGFDRAHVMHQLRLVPASSSFRAGYAYSNAGLTAGALAAAAPTGKAWEDVAEEWLFAPLGMTSTSYAYDAFVGRENAASLHVEIDGAWTPLVKRDATPQAPAGAVSSTVRDLAQWMRLELANGSFDGEPLISAKALEATHVPLMSTGANPVNGGPTFYGLGWNVQFGPHGLVWGHAGAFSQGARSVVSLLPDSGLGIVVLANAFPSGVPEGLADSFLDLVFTGAVAEDYVSHWNGLYEGLFEPAIEAAKAQFATVPDPATPALPSAAYVGTYGNAYVGTALVTDEGGQLRVAVGPDNAHVWPLTHFDRDTFISYPDAEAPDVPSAVRFAIGPDGRAATMTVEALDSNGLGTLARSAP